MKYMDVTTAAERWGITTRRVRILCNDGRVDGAIRNGWSWMIPDTTQKPRDGRVLRRFKNLDIKPGSVDVEKIDELSSQCPVTKELLQKPEALVFKARILSTLFRFEGMEVATSDILHVLHGELSYNLSLKEHLLIINFSSIMNSLVGKDTRWREAEIRELYIRLLQGIEDVSGEYRKGFVKRARNSEESSVRVSVAMETMMNQYEDTWSDLHGVVSATILAGEISRIWPFDCYRQFVMYLVLAGELMRHNILPPLVDTSVVDEAKAGYSLVYSKGIYSVLTSFIERMIVRTYGEMMDHV